MVSFFIFIYNIFVIWKAIRNKKKTIVDSLESNVLRAIIPRTRGSGVAQRAAILFLHCTVYSLQGGFTYTFANTPSQCARCIPGPITLSGDKRLLLSESARAVAQSAVSARLLLLLEGNARQSEGTSAGLLYTWREPIRAKRKKELPEEKIARWWSSDVHENNFLRRAQSPPTEVARVIKCVQEKFERAEREREMKIKHTYVSFSRETKYRARMEWRGTKREEPPCVCELCARGERLDLTID